jgi:hypothetical protein
VALRRGFVEDVGANFKVDLFATVLGCSKERSSHPAHNSIVKILSTF